MEFGDTYIEFGNQWMVICSVDHSFTIRGLEFCDFGSDSYFTPEVGKLIVMALKSDMYTPGFITQFPQKED